MRPALIALLGLMAGCGPNWEFCTPTDETRERHRAGYMQPVVAGKVTTMIWHPPRDWTERRWHCPTEEKEYYWRREG